MVIFFKEWLCRQTEELVYMISINQICLKLINCRSFIKIYHNNLWKTLGYCWYSTSSFLDYRNHQSALNNLLLNDNFRHSFFLSYLVKLWINIYLFVVYFHCSSIVWVISIGISYSSISMHLIMVFLIKIVRKITAFNKIYTHHQYFF